MISKRNTGRIFGVCLAVMYTALIVTALPALWHKIPAGLLFLLLIGLAIGFYFAGVWAAVDRPAELRKKIPMNSKELKKRKKAFFEWLESQGRH